MKTIFYPGIFLCAGVALLRMMRDLPDLRSTMTDDNSADVEADAPPGEGGRREEVGGRRSGRRAFVDADAPSLGEERLRWEEEGEMEEGGGRRRGGNRAEKLADGCRHVFLDVGSNIGVHARMLLEPHLYPSNYTKSQRRKWGGTARDFFASQFGPEHHRDPSEFCVFGFEPNPAHVPRHLEMEAAYAAAGWRYRFVRAGVSDEDGEMTFYHVGRGDKTLERGFSTQVEKCKARPGQKNNKCPEEVVKVLRLSDWIDREVHGRIIPATPTRGRTRRTSTKGEEKKKTTNISTLPPKVVMKMDIEFSEFLVFPDLLTSGVLCRDVDALMVEFHTSQRAAGDYPMSFPNRGEDGGNWTLSTNEDAERLVDDMIGLVRRNPNCRTEIVIRDDETHESDGMPWPAAAAEDGGRISRESDMTRTIH
jgi:hypothetical protein